jgi:hypothetical protein
MSISVSGCVAKYETKLVATLAQTATLLARLPIIQAPSPYFNFAAESVC